MGDHDSMDWLNDPATVRPEDYLPQMVAADAKPGDARKRARSKLDYARKLHQFVFAPPPFPPGHVFTKSFFPWLLKKYPRIQGIHPHYGRKQITSGCTIIWRNAIPPPSPLSPLAVLQKENTELQARIAELEGQLTSARLENEDWRQKDQQRRKACGRRPLTEKINS